MPSVAAKRLVCSASQVRGLLQRYISKGPAMQPTMLLGDLAKGKGVQTSIAPGPQQARLQGRPCLGVHLQVSSSWLSAWWRAALPSSQAVVHADPAA